MKARTRLVIGSFALLVVGLVAASLLIAGSSSAQEDKRPKEVEKVETVREIVSDGQLPEGWVPFPFEAALRDMIGDGRLNYEEVDQIMAILAQHTGAVSYESSSSENGQPKDVEVLVDIKIEVDGGDLSQAFQQTLDQAVAEGLLTADEAAEVLAKVE